MQDSTQPNRVGVFLADAVEAWQNGKAFVRTVTYNRYIFWGGFGVFTFVSIALAVISANRDVQGVTSHFLIDWILRSFPLLWAGVAFMFFGFMDSVPGKGMVMEILADILGAVFVGVIHMALYDMLFIAIFSMNNHIALADIVNVGPMLKESLILALLGGIIGAAFFLLVKHEQIIARFKKPA